MNVHIIANPVAGGGRGKSTAEALSRALADTVASVALSLTTCRGDAEKMAQASEADCLVAVGGDGTVNEVVNGMAGGPAMLGILPVGTANVVGRELRLPFDPEGAALLIAAGHTRAMDVGLHAGRRFMLGAGAGLDAAVVAEVAAQRGHKSSLMKWVLPAAKTVLRYRFPLIRVTVDDRVISESAQYAIVGNCRYSAGAFPATPNAVVDDGLLDVCLFHGLSIPRILALLGRVWRPGFINGPGITYVQGSSITLEPLEHPVLLQVDGDPAGELPAEFSLLPRAINVVTPFIPSPQA